MDNKDVKITGFLANQFPKISYALGIWGLIAAFFYFLQDKKQFFYAYLTSFTIFMTFTLGALFFVLLAFLTRAGWSVVVRRLAETMMQNVGIMALFFIPVAFGVHELYHWTDIDHVMHDPLLLAKRPYLNLPFFYIRSIFYFGVWIWLARVFYKGSVEQDKTGDKAITLKLQKYSTFGILLYAITQTFAFIDWVMTLTPHWYSTMFGVYLFAGSAVSIMSLLILISLLLRRFGYLKNMITVEHYHDMGKLLYGFNIFWAYIAFSQYFLIWYANIPEETHFFLEHFHGSWNEVAMLLAIGHFGIPFVLFMSRHVKRNLTLNCAMAVWILLMHLVDMNWLILPNVFKHGAHFGWGELACLVGIGGIYFGLFFARLKKQVLYAKGDPRLQESLKFQNF